MKFLKYITIPLFLVSLSACVSSGKYEKAVANADSVRNSLGKTQEKLSASQAEMDKMRKSLGSTQEKLSASQAEIVTLRKIEAETKRRNEIYAQFISRLKSMIDGGQLTVSIDAGRIVINLPDNVLFNSGSTNLNIEGQVALKKIGEVLTQFSDRRFQVEGHTDNVPIKSARFPSNWELSTARAVSVVHLLTEIGVAPENVSAAGFGEFRPRADNETEEGKKLNRRIEIIMLPNLDILSNELPKVTAQ
ncbi:Flagellar motor rotation protein MotB [hydrothermal vent metagenome]|uniref:Flagellar motor rotation protein MotB n=1 Tax=hydrothermal vent metagenome TaxID=652676 RepID=A0A3B0WSC3_9ZZZZ